MKCIIRKLIITALTASLCACGSFFDKDNTLPPTPLTKFQPEVTPHALWDRSTGWGSGDDFYTYVPAVVDNTIYTSSKNGYVTATDRTTGKTLWRINTHTPISAGPAATHHLVIVGTRAGDVVALQAMNGAVAWKAHVSSEILAPPVVNQNIALIKTIDGKLSALSVYDGYQLWQYQQTEPTLILRGASAPVISNGSVITGFANGNLVKLSSRNGHLIWSQPVAVSDGIFAIERMIDIDATPVVFGNRIYAVTYQGQIAAIEPSSGRVIWKHDLSSYTGMAVDNVHVYVTDAKGDVWAFNKNNGTLDWKQSQLEARVLSGPALQGNYLVVGDAEGYLHWLNTRDGHFAARTRVALSGIYAAPVVDNNIIYVVTQEGQLAAYQL